LLPEDRHASLRVLHVVTQLLGEVHGIDGHHHGVGAQHGVIGDDVLGAVLQGEKHPVALANPAMPLEVAGERLRLAPELAVAERRAVVVDGGAIGMLGGALHDVEEDAVPRHFELLADARRPVGEVPVEHQAAQRATASTSLSTPMPGRSSTRTWPFEIFTGSARIASAQSTYSSQWQVGVAVSR